MSMVSPFLFLTRRVFLKLALASLFWGYDGDEGPTHWSALSTSYHTCGDGARQSPIDIDLATAGAALVSFDYRPIPVALFNNGHTIRAAGDDHCTLTLDNQVYSLIQFHFHTPSEHTCGGTHYPMEIHLVHRHPTTKVLVVVGIWITPGEEQPELASLGQTLPQQAGDHFNNNRAVNPMNLLPATRTLVRYSGSLTTPPCSEDVTWLVMTTPIAASAQQIATFHQVLGNNARPLQRLGL